MHDRARRIAVLVLIGALDAVFVAAFIATDPGDASGLEELGVLVNVLALSVAAVWTAVLARGLWKGRTWAQVASLLTFGPMAVVALFLSIDVVRRMQVISSQAAPRVHLIAPALVTIFAGSITALVSSSVRRERA
jgi:hypothetical protein